MSVSSMGHQATVRLVKIFASLLIATAISPSFAQSAENTLTIGLASGPRSFDTLKAAFYTRGNEALAQLIHEGLVWRDTNDEYQPLLATSWSVSDDKKTWTFQLRRDVTFHDGTSFGAIDVQQHFMRMIDPKVKHSSRSFFQPVQRVEAVGKHTVLFHLEHPWPAIIPWLAMIQIAPLIPSSANVETGLQGKQPSGTGPYRLSKWARNNFLRLERNEQYWGAVSGPEVVIFRILPDEQSRLAALRTGQIDITQLYSGESIEQAIADPILRRHEFSGSGGAFLMLNQRDKRLADPRVRAAIAHAIDQPTALKVIFNSHRKPIEHLLGTTVPCEETRYKKYDPDKARALLADYGEPLTFKFLALATNNRYGQVVQKMLSDVGITTEVESTDFKTYTKRMRGGKFELIGWGTRSNPDMGAQLYGYSHSKAGHNPTRYADPEMDKLVERMRRAETMQERAQLQCEVSRRINESAHMVWMGSWNRNVFSGKRVGGEPVYYGMINARSIQLKQ